MEEIHISTEHTLVERLAVLSTGYTTDLDEEYVTHVQGEVTHVDGRVGAAHLLTI